MTETVELVEPPLNYNRGVLAASVSISGDLVVYGFRVHSTKGTAQYVNVFDSSVLPADTAVPAFSLAVGANADVAVSYGSPGRRFQYGLTLCSSSTDATKTIGSADCFFDVQYDMASSRPSY